MLGRQRRAVHLVGQQGLAGVPERQRALVGLGPAALQSAVEAGEQRLHRAVAHAGLFEQRRQRGAAPLGGADRLRQPGLADRARLEEGAAVAGALEGDGHGDPLARLEIREAEAQRSFHGTVHLERENGGIHGRDVVVDQQVVQACGGDVVAKRLERQRVVARGEAQLGGGDPLSCNGAVRGVHGRDASRGLDDLSPRGDGNSSRPPWATRQRRSETTAPPAASPPPPRRAAAPAWCTARCGRCPGPRPPLPGSP